MCVMLDSPSNIVTCGDVLCVSVHCLLVFDLHRLIVEGLEHD